jgi:glycosyltransferase involved in cell wall biosynthesis
MSATDASAVGVGPRRSRLDPGAVSFRSVVHINEKGGSFGGTEEYVALLTAALSAAGVRSSLICGLVTGSLPAGLDEIRIIPGLAERRPRAGTADAVAAAVAELDADVVYVHNVFDPAIVPAIAALAGRGVVLWYVHDHYLTCLSELRWRRDVGSCPQRLGEDCLTAIGHGHCVMRHPVQVHVGADVERRTALSRSMAHADGLIVVSQYMRSLLVAAEPRLERVLHVLSRPIRDLGAPRPRRRARANEPAVVTYAGRINSEKGLAIVIEALALMRCSAPVELRIAGVVEDEQYWASCQQLLAAAEATDHGVSATYLGHLDYDTTDELLAQSDIVTIPSRWPEPLGAVALEAMAAGAAVIASPVGGLADVVVHGHNGLHAAPGDVAAWSDALTTLVEQPATADRLGRQAHADVTGTGIADHLRDLDTLVTTYRAAAG